MIPIISPAKKLAHNAPFVQEGKGSAFPLSESMFFQKTCVLVKTLKTYSIAQLQQLMNLSESLATLNCQRYQDFSLAFDAATCLPALTTFQGDTYKGLDAQNSFAADDFEYANHHLRILSGLYGLLRPHDGIQPHRLEMGTRLALQNTSDLYAFWGLSITQALNTLADEDQILVNCASQEYIRSVHRNALTRPMIDVHFMESTHGKAPRVIGIHAKKARGAMARFILKNRLTRPEDLKSFCDLKYRYHSQLSEPTHYVFIRES